jgi:hypothetical protein
MLIMGCSKQPGKLVWHKEKGYKWASITHNLPHNTSRVGFKQLNPKRTGINFINHLSKSDIIKNRYYLSGSGVAAGDVNGDGLADLYFAQLDGPNHLYKNLGDYHFKDITKSAGVALSGYHCTGVVLADVDGDGDLDLLVTTLGEGNCLYLNDGKGHFTLDKDSGLGGKKKGSMTMTLADIDGDGDLDLYIANYKTKSVRDLYKPDQLTFKKITEKHGNKYKLIPPFNKFYKIVQTPHGPVRREIGQKDELYINNGKGHFSKVKDLSKRFLNEDGKPEGLKRDFGLSARFYDINGDGLPDLYVCNDFWTPDRIWINQGNGIFKAINKRSIRHLSFSSMSVAFSDINRDGLPDIFVSEMVNPSHKIEMRHFASYPPVMPRIGDVDSQPQCIGNTLFIQRKDGTYYETAELSGLKATGWSWAANFLDVDLDGYEDIIINNGMLYDELNLDTQSHLIRLNRKKNGNVKGYILKYPPLKLTNKISHNNHNLTFSDSSSAWGFHEKDVSNGMALADLNNDGDLDIIDNRLNETAAIYKNITSKPRIAVRLKSEKPNTEGIGSKIKLIGPPVTQTKQITKGGSYLSSNQAEAVFAAGEKNSVHKLVVTWPNGEKSVIDSVKANRIYEIDEPGIRYVHHKHEETSAKKKSHYIFQDISQQIDHTHHEDLYDDFKVQPLLPIKLSQLGPGIAWLDYNDDGYPDLLIGSGKGGKLSIYKNNHGNSFTNKSLPPITGVTSSDETAILGWQTKGGLQLVIGISNYEQNKSNVPSAYHYLIQGGKVVEVNKIKDTSSSTGTLAAADYDEDGDIDLFVGGRVIKGKYPQNASSRLFKNKNGHFVLDKKNSKLLQHIGLVTQAVFTDYNQDGWPDLLISTAWGSLKLFKNNHGQFQNVTKEVGLAKYKGWWNGVATGDFNNDGYPDIVATNWGINNSYYRHKTPSHPVKIFYNHYKNSNKNKILEAYYDTAFKAYVPKRRLYNIVKSIPNITRYISSYKQFSHSTLRNLIGVNLKYMPQKEINTLKSMVFINSGNGNFKAHPLPLKAQLSVAFYAGVADFNDDGNEDIFLSQNFFDLPKTTRRQDAGRGLWLKGDGHGNFKAIPGQRSGIKVYGEQRGAALGDFNHDGKVDLAVSQNGAAIKLYKNDTPKSGISIRLIGPPANRDAMGSSIRIVYADGTKGPGREIQAGSGYWSQNSAIQVMGYAKRPQKIEVIWFDGHKSYINVSQGNGQFYTIKYRSPD